MVVQKIIDENIVMRSWYIDKIKKYLHTPIIKVLIGQRRVGKSTILKSIIQELYHEKLLQKENIFYINKELFAYDDINTYESLKSAFQLFLTTTKSGTIFVGVDEIQDIIGREKFINGLLAEYKSDIEIFITGSNAFLLSGELATYLTGRYIEFEIFPLSFYEFCLFKKESKTKQNFLDYLKYGGLPGIFEMNYTEEVLFSYLYGIYMTIVLKDIIYHHQIKNIIFFKNLYKYTLKNIGNIMSGKSIGDYLKSKKIAIGNETILNFLGYAQQTFLLHKVYSVNPHSKKYFEIYNKFYAGDLGLRNALVGFDFKSDIGKLLENYVYLTLKRYNYKITIGRLNSNKEIDFMIEKNGLIKYIQVCYLLGGEEAMKREYSTLEQISDNRPKYIISFDDINHGTYRGIEHINVMHLEDIL